MNVKIVNTTELTHFAGKKEDFLANEANKKAFVMLNIELLQHRGCNVILAE